MTKRARGPLINGRTVSNQSGVGRYTRGLVSLDVADVIIPGKRFSKGLAGVLWEQLWLPIRARGRLLISPANGGTLLKRRQIVVIHDIAPALAPSSYRWTYVQKFRATIWWFRFFGTTIVTGSHSSSVALETTFGVVCSAVWSSILSEEFTPSVERESEPALPYPYLLFVGADARKNFAIFLKAAAVANLPSATRIVRAGVPSHVHVEATSDEGSMTRVVDLGFIEDDRLAELYRDATALVTLSAHEGFGLPLIEAFAADCPVIASDIAAHRETARDAALFVPLDDIGAISSALEQVVNDEQLQASLRRAGRSRLNELHALPVREVVLATIEELA